MPADLDSKPRKIVAAKAKVMTTYVDVFDITDTVIRFGTDDFGEVMEHEEWFGGEQQPESHTWDSDTSPIITVTYDDDTVETYTEFGLEEG